MTFYKGNKHWMVRDGEWADREPMGGCESCGWLDDDGVEVSDLIWSGALGMWLCMECD